jgi:hypothetical protein
MRDLQREILNQVASGAISAEEGAARLETLESPARPTSTSQPAAGAPVKQVKVVSRFGNAEIVGDSSVAYAVAEGPHRARQEGDTMVIEQTPVAEDTSFEFNRPHARVVINGFDFGRKLTVRVNPSLALTANVQAGNLRVDGMHGPITSEVQAGNCKVNDFRGPINLVVSAGNLNASGRIDGGTNTVRCEMGSVKVILERGSNVRIKARTSLGKFAVEGDGVREVSEGRDGKEITVGSGDGTLDVECTMGNMKVAVA